jgi:signal transduction histidine kinase
MMNAEEDWLIPYRLRTVRVLVRATALSVSFMLVALILPQVPGDPKGSFLIVVGIVALAGICIGLTPWVRLFREGRGLQWVYVWTAVFILLVSVAIVISGNGSSDLFYMYALTTVFLAASFWPSGQVTLMAFTAACYSGVLALTGWDITPSVLFIRIAILGTLGLLSSFLSRVLMEQMAAHRAAQVEAGRRASMLATVAKAARSMSTLDPERVLTEVVECAMKLGFQAAALSLFDEEREIYRVAHASGLPRDFVADSHPWNTGMPGLVREELKTVVVDDYETHPLAVPELAADGFKAVIASPVWSHDDLVAVLVSGTREERDLTEPDVEAFELLATQAGRALENARRFESERRAVERLAELDGLKRDFLSTVSHELRTPLTAIEGLGLTLEQQWFTMDDRTRLDLLRRLNANSMTLDEIIRTLLDFSRLESGRLEAHLDVVDIGALVREVAARLEGLMADHEMVTQIESDLLVQGDPMLLDRVVENLLANAAKHTPPGTRVILSVRARRGDAVISVTDDGPGIPTEELKHIGDRFYRGSNTATYRIRGLGLGLALVSEVLELHGSELEVDSHVDQGSQFRFRLPVVPGPVPDHRPDADIRQEPGVARVADG